MNMTRLRSSLLLLSLGLSPGLLSHEAAANATGKVGVTTTGCTCHSGGVTPTVSLEVPEKAIPGQTYRIRFHVSNPGSQTHAGLDVGATGGTLSVIPGDSSVKLVSGEITHTGPRQGNGSETVFEMNWTAPSSFTTVTLNAAGNAVDKKGSNSGDKFALTSAVIALCGDSDDDGEFSSACGGQDCNDSNPDISPNADEICNGVDDDCDGEIDEQVTSFLDDDGDSYGDPLEPREGCPGTGLSSNDLDCDDSRADVHPSASEVCDAIDNDCDSGVDEGVMSTFFADSDGDLYGNANVTTLACSVPQGYSTNDDDCLDSRADVNPEGVETCDGIDNDCDALVDDNDDNVVNQKAYAPDMDSDGFGSSTGELLHTCSPLAPSGFAANQLDCNDASSAINPSAAEVCNSVDDDCDGQVDEGVMHTYYPDEDLDGFGTSEGAIESCSAPHGYASRDGDCDDSSPTVGPHLIEAPGQCEDGIDQDCNGQDLSCDTQDLDGDHQAPIEGDCNDSDASIYLGAAEICEDGTDQDCSGSDLSCDAVDQDGDGQSVLEGDCDDTDDAVYLGALEADAQCGDDIDQDCSGSDLSCLTVDLDGDGYTGLEGDCDDDDSERFPGAEEVPYDGVDQDCSGQDLMDVDGDGVTGGPTGEDCDDSSSGIYPGAEEVCGNGVDDDCSGGADDLDQDGDGAIAQTCDGADCDDENGEVHPGAVDACEDGVDQDCVGGDAACSTPEPTLDPDESTATPESDEPTPSTASPTPGTDESPTPGQEEGGCSQQGSSSRGSSLSLLLVLMAVAARRRRARGPYSR